MKFLKKKMDDQIIPTIINKFIEGLSSYENKMNKLELIDQLQFMETQLKIFNASVNENSDLLKERNMRLKILIALIEFLKYKTELMIDNNLSIFISNLNIAEELNY